MWLAEEARSAGAEAVLPEGHPASNRGEWARDWAPTCWWPRATVPWWSGRRSAASPATRPPRAPPGVSSRPSRRLLTLPRLAASAGRPRRSPAPRGGAGSRRRQVPRRRPRVVTAGPRWAISLMLRVVPMSSLSGGAGCGHPSNPAGDRGLRCVRLDNLPSSTSGARVGFGRHECHPRPTAPRPAAPARRCAAGSARPAPVVAGAHDQGLMLRRLSTRSASQQLDVEGAAPEAVVVLAGRPRRPGR
jgi:hypothetical protein